MEGEQDERVKFILKEIYLDEARHHKFLSNLLEVVVKRDIIFDEEIWNQLWRARSFYPHQSPLQHLMTTFHLIRELKSSTVTMDVVHLPKQVL